MKMFSFNHWFPFFSMWFNPKTRMCCIALDDLEVLVQTWDQLSEEQKAMWIKTWKYLTRKDKKGIDK